MMGTSWVFFQVLAAAWLIGGALGIGLYQSRKARWARYSFIGYVWALVFSWAFVGWILAELWAWTITEARAQVKASIAAIRGENE